MKSIWKRFKIIFIYWYLKVFACDVENFDEVLIESQNLLAIILRESKNSVHLSLSEKNIKQSYNNILYDNCLSAAAQLISESVSSVRRGRIDAHPPKRCIKPLTFRGFQTRSCSMCASAYTNIYCIQTCDAYIYTHGRENASSSKESVIDASIAESAYFSDSRGPLLRIFAFGTRRRTRSSQWRDSPGTMELGHRSSFARTVKLTGCTCN